MLKETKSLRVELSKAIDNMLFTIRANHSETIAPALIYIRELTTMADNIPYGDKKLSHEIHERLEGYFRDKIYGRDSAYSNDGLRNVEEEIVGLFGTVKSSIYGLLEKGESGETFPLKDKYIQRMKEMETTIISNIQTSKEKKSRNTFSGTFIELQKAYKTSVSLSAYDTKGAEPVYDYGYGAFQKNDYLNSGIAVIVKDFDYIAKCFMKQFFTEDIGNDALIFGWGNFVSYIGNEYASPGSDQTDILLVPFFNMIEWNLFLHQVYMGWHEVEQMEHQHTNGTNDLANALMYCGGKYTDSMVIEKTNEILAKGLLLDAARCIYSTLFKFHEKDTNGFMETIVKEIVGGRDHGNFTGEFTGARINFIEELKSNGRDVFRFMASNTSELISRTITDFSTKRYNQDDLDIPADPKSVFDKMIASYIACATTAVYPYKHINFKEVLEYDFAGHDMDSNVPFPPNSPMFALTELVIDCYKIVISAKCKPDKLTPYLVRENDYEDAVESVKETLSEYITNYAHIISVMTYLSRGRQQSKSNLSMNLPKNHLKNLTLDSKEEGHLTTLKAIVLAFLRYSENTLRKFKEISYIRLTTCGEYSTRSMFERYDQSKQNSVREEAFIGNMYHKFIIAIMSEGCDCSGKTPQDIKISYDSLVRGLKRLKFNNNFWGKCDNPLHATILSIMAGFYHVTLAMSNKAHTATEHLRLGTAESLPEGESTPWDNKAVRESDSDEMYMAYLKATKLSKAAKSFVSESAIVDFQERNRIWNVEKFASECDDVLPLVNFRNNLTRITSAKGISATEYESLIKVIDKVDDKLGGLK